MPSDVDAGPAGGTPIPFAGLALDRAGERREDPEWLSATWPAARVLAVDFEGKAALDAARGALWSLPGADLGLSQQAQASFLGLAGGVPWFALPAEALDAATASEVPAWGGLREVAALLDPLEAGLFAYAKALLLWQSRARYCGACGSPMALRRGGHSARCANPDCRLEHFPRTDAAVIVLVTHGDRALLGRQAGWPARRWSTLAGFVEPGESLEDALRREVAEESGVRVGPCIYRHSQPWPFPASLMLGFRAEAVDPTIRVGEELEDARWIGADALLDAIAADEIRMPFPISLSFRLIADWLLEAADPVRVRTLLPGA